MKPIGENRRNIHGIVLGKKILDWISNHGQQTQK